MENKLNIGKFPPDKMLRALDALDAAIAEHLGLLSLQRDSDLQQLCAIILQAAPELAPAHLNYRILIRSMFYYWPISFGNLIPGGYGSAKRIGLIGVCQIGRYADPGMPDFCNYSPAISGSYKACPQCHGLGYDRTMSIQSLRREKDPPPPHIPGISEPVAELGMKLTDSVFQLVQSKTFVKISELILSLMKDLELNQDSYRILFIGELFDDTSKSIQTSWLRLFLPAMPHVKYVIRTRRPCPKCNGSATGGKIQYVDKKDEEGRKEKE